MEVWVNPACSKCRAATAALDEAGVGYTVRRYLEQPPTASELVTVLDRLELEPWDIARTGEQVAAQIGLHDLPRDTAHRDRWVGALVEHPVLIQRPIVTADDGTAVLARDPAALERVVELAAGQPISLSSRPGHVQPDARA